MKLVKTNKTKNISKFNTYYQLNTYYQGFIKSRGEIICFLDSDDYLKKNKLSKIDYYFSKHENMGFLGRKSRFGNRFSGARNSNQIIRFVGREGKSGLHFSAFEKPRSLLQTSFCSEMAKTENRK